LHRDSGVIDAVPLVSVAEKRAGTTIRSRLGSASSQASTCATRRWSCRSLDGSGLPRSRRRRG